jgi:hypothetical protein
MILFKLICKQGFTHYLNVFFSVVDTIYEGFNVTGPVTNHTRDMGIYIASFQLRWLSSSSYLS